MTIKEAIRELREMKKESTKEEVAKRIRKIAEKGEERYQIIVMLVKEERERGYTKKYSLRELVEKMPWKKSRAIEKLQEMIKEEIVKYERKKYELNRKNDGVKRIREYYNEPSYWRKEEREEIKKLNERKKELREKIEEKRREKKKGYKEMKEKEEREYRKKIEEELREGSTKEELKEFIKKNIEKTLGREKREEK